MDEPHTVTLFDVNPYKKGILMPNEYLKLFQDLHIAPLLYHGNGNANSEFEASVRNGTLEGITLEGVVCKACNGKTPMLKIKNQAWFDRLRERCIVP